MITISEAAAIESFSHGSSAVKTSDADRTPLLARGLQGLLVMGVAIYVGWMLMAPVAVVGRDTWFVNALLVLGVGLLVYRVVHDKQDRVAWACFAIGAGIWTTANILGSASVGGGATAAFPGVAEWLYLGLYPFAYAGAILLVRSRVKSPPLNVWLDGLLAALGAGAFIWLAAPALSADLVGGFAAKFIILANPLGDLLLLCLLVGLLGVMGWHADRMWWLLVGASFVLCISDTGWLLTIADGQVAAGSAVRVGWVVALTLVALASWSRARSQLTPAAGLRSAAVPIAVTAASFGLLIFATQQKVSTGAVALASGAILVGAMRLGQAFRQASLQAEIHRQAHTDELTGLANRRLMDQRLADALDVRGVGQQQACALLLLDVDSFKEINDSLGHAAGDEVLQVVSTRITEQLWGTDTVARLGGDEFAILLGPGTSPAGAVTVAERIRNEIARPLRIGGTDLRIDVSVGIAMCPDHARNREDLLRAADTAMYRAKRSGSGHAIYEPGQDVADRGRMLLVHELRAAILGDQLLCEFQPKIDISTGEVSSCEALIRWQHPQDGLLYPATFLPVAERAGLMKSLSECVLQLALDQSATWREAGLPSRVSVNLSMTCLLEPDFPDVVAGLLLAHDVDPADLILEITETVLINEPKRVHRVVDQFHEIGITISVDDYGTGYSSLAELRRLKAQELKLDKSLVSGVAHRSDLRAIVHTSVELAHDLGLKLVAEGVESGEDLAELAVLGCDLAQGYFICAPSSVEDITEWLRSKINSGGAEVPSQRSGSTQVKLA